MKKRLTARQAEVLDYMRDYFSRNDQLPSREAMRTHFGWVSSNAATDFCRLLERRGYIEKNESRVKYRFTRDV